MISNKKVRPPNGPGANGLRGGRNTYGGKTAVGPWLDAVGGSMGYSRGFTTEEFKTEAQHQQLGVVRRPPPYYGAGLPKAIVDMTPTAADTLSSKSGLVNDWSTTTRVMTTYNDKSCDREFNVAKSNMKDDQLALYRTQWTLDHPASRTTRYMTETRRSTNTASNVRFTIPSVRLLPGTPRPVETFRSVLIEKYGILSFLMLRYHCGTGMVSYRHIQRAVNALEIKTTYSEFNQIVAYFTAEDNLNADNFVRTVVAMMEDFDSARVDALFISMFGDISDAPVGEILGRLNIRDYPEVVEGLRQFVEGAYARVDRSVLTRGEFMLVHSDMYAAAPEVYSAVIDSIWRM